MLYVYTFINPIRGINKALSWWSGIIILIPKPKSSPILEPIVLIIVILEYNSPILPPVDNFPIHFVLIAPKPVNDKVLKILDNPAIGRK